MAVVCHVILQENVIKVYCEFMGRRTSREFTILPNLVVIGIAVVEI